MFLNAMNYEILQRIFFTHPDNVKFLFDTFDINSDSTILPVSIFELYDSSTIILFHDSKNIFISIFSEGMFLKVDDILLSIFERSYNDIFHTYKKFNIQNLVVCMFSKDYIFNETSAYFHQYNSTQESRIKASQLDTQEDFNLFDDIVINVIELRKGFHYSDIKDVKNLSGILIGEDLDHIIPDQNLNGSQEIKDIIQFVDSLNWHMSDLMKYYENQSRSQKIVETQKNAFHEGFKLGQHDGQISTAYFIKGLVSEKNPNLDEFLFNLCYVNNKNSAIMIE